MSQAKTQAADSWGDSVRLLDCMDKIAHEYTRAASKFGRLNSLHEAYAVILEEVDELWSEVKVKQENRAWNKIEEELVDIAAMCVATLLDLVAKRKDK